MCKLPVNSEETLKRQRHVAGPNGVRLTLESL